MYVNPNLPTHPTPPSPLWYPCVCSLRLCLYFCFADRFTYTNQLGFPDSSVGKESTCNAGDPASIPGSGRSPGEGNGNPLQDSCLENPMDCGLPGSSVHGVARVRHGLVTKPPPPANTVSLLGSMTLTKTRSKIVTSPP